MRIAIHQPNLVPWYPYFQKIMESDMFVIMGHCQYEKGNYQNRFNIDDKWNSMQVDKGKLKDTIIEKQYKKPEYDWDLILSKHYKLDVFTDLINESVYDTNSNIIERACEILKINTPLTIDYKTSLKGTQRLVDICLRYGANEYLSGISGRHYLDVSLFKHHGIKVVFQDESKMIKEPLINFL